MVLASYIVSLIYFISVIILLISLLRRKRLTNPSLLWVTLYVILALIVFILLAFIRNPSLQNLHFTIYTILEFLIMGELLDTLVVYKKKKVFKLLRRSLSLIVFIFILLDNAIYKDNLWVAEFASLFLIIQSLISMNLFLRNENIDHFKSISFWLIISVFFLHVFSIPIVVYDYYLFNSFFIDSTLITRISNFSIYIIFNCIINISINRLC